MRHAGCGGKFCQVKIGQSYDLVCRRCRVKMTHLMREHWRREAQRSEKPTR